MVAMKLSNTNMDTGKHNSQLLCSGEDRALVTDCTAGSVTDKQQHAGTGSSKASSRSEMMSQVTEQSPRYLVIRRLDGEDFNKVSPVMIQKALYSQVGSLRNVKKTRDGLLVETTSAAQSNKLLKLVTLSSMRIAVSPHHSLNIAKGVIYCKDLMNSTIDEIEQELHSQGVIEVKRIQSKRSGELQDTPTHILTFNKPKLPEKVRVAFYSLPVRQYIPAPMRCFKCQRFGHTSVRCTNDQVCACGSQPHEGDCTDQPKCVNCGGPHSARSRNCSIYKQEMAIQEMKTKENLTYFEARKKVIPSNTPNMSYARAAAVPPTIDMNSFIKELVPSLVSILKEVFLTKSVVTDSHMPPPTGSSRAPMKPTPTQDLCLSDTNLEKRKRQDVENSVSSRDDGSESVTSQDSNVRPEFKKKKRGWQKGRARKPPDDSQ